MAIMDPTGGLREISKLNQSTPSIFHEDFNSDNEEEEGSARETHTPLVSQKPRRQRTYPHKSAAHLIRTLDYGKLNYRARLTLRITSMIMSGTTLGALGSALFTYTRTQDTHMGDVRVWPADLEFRATHYMLAAAVITFLADFGFFCASIKPGVRRLHSKTQKATALTATAVCLALVVAAVVVDGVVERSGRNTLFWTCVAKRLEWNGVEVDFPFLCGEMIAARWTLIGTLVLQAAILATILIDMFYRPKKPKKPKPVAGQGYKIVKGWRAVLDRIGL